MERFWLRSPFLYVSTLTLALGSIACGSDDPDESPTDQARIVSFAADPASLVEGEPTVLSWTTEHAHTVRLVANGVLLAGDLQANDTLEVTPTRSTTYALEVIGKNRRPASLSTEVEVTPHGGPGIERFEASAPVIAPGGSVTLSWSVARAESVELREGSGRVLVRDAPAEGTFEVTPARTTTFALHARNRHGTASQDLTVGVGDAPTLVFTASPEHAEHGSDLTLAWEATNAESVTIHAPDGSIVHAGPAETGSIVVQADGSGRYRAVAFGIGGQVEASAGVLVRPTVVEFAASVQGEGRVGAPALVHWDVVGAEEIELVNGSGVVIPLTQPSGSMTVPMGTGGNFLLRAANGGAITEQGVVAEVVESPLIRVFEAEGLVTAGQGQSGVAKVRWEIDGAAQIQVTRAPGGLVDVSQKSTRNDEADVTFLGPGTVTLTARNPAGISHVTIPAPVDPVPTIESFLAAPSRVGSGEAAEIHWEVADAQTVVLEMNGTVVQTYDPAGHRGSFDTPILAATSVYVLRASNSLGFETVSAPLVVEIGAPNILSLRTHDGRSLYPIEETIEIHWRNDGGSQLTLTDETGQVVCTRSAPLEIREGFCEVELPDRQSEKTYLLQVSNASGVDTRAIEVQAVTGPIITSFTADRSAITEGETVLFSWTVERDIEGNLPELTLTDQNGTPYPMDGVDPLEGSKRFTIPTHGDYTFTLVASSAVKPDFPLDLPLKVHGIPVIDNMAATPTFAENEGDPIVFEWTTLHGASMEILALDRLGNPGDVLFSSSDEATVAAGSATLYPTIDEPNLRVRVRNPLGTPNHADFRIGVSPASIDFFIADRTEILVGEEVTLSWATSRATNAHIDGFVDISKRPTATDLNLRTGDGGEATFQFPSGFRFPYDGQTFTQARATVDGWLSFNPHAAGYCCNGALPSTDATIREIDLAPYWDDLHTTNNTPHGTVYWEYFADPSPHIIVQWTNVGFWTSSRNPADLNFQIVLHENGHFEYRYGRMYAQSNYGNGQDATIAAQNRSGSEANLISYNTTWEGGLSDSGLYFERWDADPTFARAPVDLSGSRTVSPTSTRTYRLRAWNGHSEHEMDVTVNVYPRGELSVWSVPAEPVPGEPVTLHWSGLGLTSLEVEDEAGNLLHTASPAELASGSLPLGSFPMGTYDFTVRAVGLVDFDQITETIAVPVYDPFSIDSFEASASLVRTDALPITLSWTTTNATSATLTPIPGGSPIVLDPAELASGNLVQSPGKTTTYRLEVESHGRFREAEVTVQVQAGWIEDFTASPNPIGAGGSSTLTWQTGGSGYVTLIGPGINPPAGPLVEVTGDAEFQDISATGVQLVTNAAGSSYNNIQFNSFSFPYFGNYYSQVTVAGTSVISFDSGISGWKWTPTSLPNSSEGHVHLAPFWGDLQGGNLHGECFSEPLEHCVLQFTNWRPWDEVGDMNFQVAMHKSGAIEYRYGSMESVSMPLVPQGANITVGLQAPGGGKGTQIHSGSGTFAGGFANRAWRWMPTVAASDSLTVTPSTSGTYVLCVYANEMVDCQEIEVEVN